MSEDAESNGVASNGVESNGNNSGGAWRKISDDHHAAGNSEGAFMTTVEAAVANAAAEGTPSSSQQQPASAPAAAGPAAAAPTAAAAAPTAAKPTAAPATAAPAAKEPPAKVPIWLKPPPNKKSYMPTFSAPEAYGKKADPKYAQMRRDAEEKVAKDAARKERQKARERAKRRKAKEGPVVAQVEEEGADWQLFFLIILGIFTALAEALDLDVLIGILLMPFMNIMKHLAVKFDNVNLDPQTWIDAIGSAYNNMCR